MTLKECLFPGSRKASEVSAEAGMLSREVEASLREWLTSETIKFGWVNSGAWVWFGGALRG